MTSVALWTQLASAAFCPLVFFHNSRALNSNASYKKNEQVQQADLFKWQTLVFIFQHVFHIYLSFYPIYQVTGENQLLRSLHRLSLIKATLRPGRFFSTTLSWLWANFLHQTCIAGLVKQLASYTGHIILNCIGAKSFRQDKINAVPCGMFSMVMSPYFNVYNWRHSDVIVM